MVLLWHTWSEEVNRCMQSISFDSTHDQTMSGVTCHHHPWAAESVGQRRAWHAIIAHGQHTRSDNVSCGMASLPLDSTTQMDDIGRGIPSSPSDCRRGRTTSGVACYHLPKAAHTVNDFGCLMPSFILGTKHIRTTSGVVCHHLP